MGATCFFILTFLHLGLMVSATNVHVVNNAECTICAKYWVPNWVGGGCRELKAGQACDLGASAAWVGATMWAIPGSCGGGHEPACNTGPPSGVTQFEFTINGFSNLDYYDLSMASGFNMGMTMAPTNPACPALFCKSSDHCDGTKVCASGSTDYVVTYY